MASELLKGFRMLDLADEKGALAGKIFADMGAEVIKVEPPRGCPTRTIAPFLEDLPGPDRSLYAIAYHAGKKSVTANLDSPGGRELLAALAAKSDFLVESFDPGHLESIGLGYDALAKRNPRLIYTSITPFGDRGPARDYKWADIISWAAGGAMYMMGEEGKPPLQMSLPQAGLHAGGEASVASMLAHQARQRDGFGQRIVVNMQACIVWTLMNEQAMPILHGDYIKRTGVFTGSKDTRRKMVYRCKDGHISTLIAGGTLGGASTKALIAWMNEAGFAAQWMLEKDWTAWVPGMFMALTERDHFEINDLEDRIQKFFMTMTKQEIYAGTLKRRILLAPVATVADIAADPQLKAREYFVEVEHDALGRRMTMPGAFAKLSRTPIGAPTPAPAIGQHNGEIYGGLLGLGAARLGELKSAGAI
ncbi:MAG TPA: CoA transferase [Candidatus Binataceae bacterium]|nr:CoA transferase [Candidatus Binataceae bacterium]